MTSLFKNFGVALCGLITCILVAIADVVITRTTGFNFFTFSIWVVVPVGAMITGFTAASGYYFGSLYFHKRPSAMLFIQMVAIAGLTQFLIYWLGYMTLVLDNGQKVASLVSFKEYLHLILTKAHYGFGRSQVDTGEVGSLGYWIAVAQFVGFLFGGILIFAFLTDKPVCSNCNLYLRHLAKKYKRFANNTAAGNYYDRLFTLPVGSPEFADLIQSDAKVDKVKAGILQIDTSLFGCPNCKAQMVEEKVSGFNGNDWQDMPELKRRVAISSGTDLAPIFRK